MGTTIAKPHIYLNSGEGFDDPAEIFLQKVVVESVQMRFDDRVVLQEFAVFRQSFVEIGERSEPGHKIVIDVNKSIVKQTTLLPMQDSVEALRPLYLLAAALAMLLMALISGPAYLSASFPLVMEVTSSAESSMIFISNMYLRPTMALGWSILGGGRRICFQNVNQRVTITRSSVAVFPDSFPLTES